MFVDQIDHVWRALFLRGRPVDPEELSETARMLFKKFFSPEVSLVTLSLSFSTLLLFLLFFRD